MASRSSSRSPRISLAIPTLLLILIAFQSDRHSRIRAAPTPPKNVTIGALLALHTKIGRAARSALQLAVQQINQDPSILNSTALQLLISNTDCSALRGAAAAVDLMQKHVIAIAGPQTSEEAQFVAHMGSATQIPIVSFSATDATLAEAQSPFFIRMAHSDRIQMEAIADLVRFFEWKEVVALYSGDNFGTNGIMELHDSLSRIGATISFRAAVSNKMSKDEIGALLAGFSDLGGRIFVVHTDSSVGRTVLTQAFNLRLLMTGFVWIVTDAITSVLDSIYYDDEFLTAAQGVIGTRIFVPNSTRLDRFRSNWEDYHLSRLNPGLKNNVNVYAIYAYDTMWVLANAIDKLISRAGGDFEFDPSSSSPSGGEVSDLEQLPRSKRGAELLEELERTSLDGISGRIEFNGGRELAGSDFEIVNMRGNRAYVSGYWNKLTRFSVDAPGSSRSHSGEKLRNILWPGDSMQVPQGLMIPKIGKELIIGVPYKQGYKEFVDSKVVNASFSSSRNGTFHGFCIDVFRAALSYLPYSVTYSFVAFGDGSSTPSYDELVEMVASKKYDAAVGDITITKKRARIVDFTQPYTMSGLALVVPVVESHSHQAWAFLRPFSYAMWCTTAAFFLFTGAVVWILEHNKNEDFGGRPNKQIVTTLWFIFSTLFFSHREKIKSILGRIVVIIWLFVVLILISSYIASFTSILTVRRLKPTIQGLSRLVESGVRIGYQQGSFVRDYLLDLNVKSERLVPFSSLSSYSAALSQGKIGAVVDELPYVQLLLSSDCQFQITGEDEFSKSAWGFAFPKGSTLAADVSTAILTLAESGELQRIHETWLHTLQCSGKVVKVTSDTLDLRAFYGLFWVFGVVVLVGSVLFALRTCWQNYKTALLAATPLSWPSHFSRGALFVSSFNSYVWRTGKNTSDPQRAQIHRERSL